MRNTHDVSFYYIIIMTSINRGSHKTQYRHHGPHNTTMWCYYNIILYGWYTACTHHTQIFYENNMNYMIYIIRVAAENKKLHSGAQPMHNRMIIVVLPRHMILGTIYRLCNIVPNNIIIIY